MKKNTISKNGISYEICGETKVKGVARTTVGLIVTRGDKLNSTELGELLQEIRKDSNDAIWQLADLCAFVRSLPESPEKTVLRQEVKSVFSPYKNTADPRFAVYSLAATWTPTHLRKELRPDTAYKYLGVYRNWPDLQELLARHDNWSDARKELISKFSGATTHGVDSIIAWAKKAADTPTVLGRAELVKNAGAEAEVLYAETIADYAEQLDVTKMSNDDLITLIPVLRDLCASVKVFVK